MKVRVDTEHCQGHARCHSVAPRVYFLDDLGFNALVGETEVPVSLEDDARAGAAACPERAIQITEDDLRP
jgi:ferredoxin